MFKISHDAALASASLRQPCALIYSIQCCYEKDAIVSMSVNREKANAVIHPKQANAVIHPKQANAVIHPKQANAVNLHLKNSVCMVYRFPNCNSSVILCWNS